MTVIYSLDKSMHGVGLLVYGPINGDDASGWAAKIMAVWRQQYAVVLMVMTPVFGRLLHVSIIYSQILLEA
jgi:hypothetical protein